MPSGGSPSGTDDGGIEIVDAGLGGGDNGETHEDAGTGDAGLADGGDTSASDAGTPVDGGALPGDGGFTLPDGGVSEYVGEAEVGVVCGESGDTCAAGSSCCVALAGFSLAGTCTESAEGSCESGAYPIGCDGKEDCTGEGEVCCLAGIEQALGFDLSKLRGSCIAATECVDVTTAGEEESRQQACVESSECPNDEVCCGVSGGFISLPIDVGVCASACEL